MPSIFLTEEELDARYPFINNSLSDEEDDQKFDIEPEHLREVNKADPACIWTQVEYQDGIAIVSGYRFVNRICYYISKNPVPAGDEITVVIMTDDKG